MDWAIELLRNYWPAVFIFIGIAGPLWGLVEGWDDWWIIFLFVFLLGMGIVLFLYDQQAIGFWLETVFKKLVIYVIGVFEKLVLYLKADAWGDLMGEIRELGYWLLRGAWYDVTLKIAGAIGLIVSIHKTNGYLVSLVENSDSIITKLIPAGLFLLEISLILSLIIAILLALINDTLLGAKLV